MKKFIVVAGNIGSGKTTLTRYLSRYLGFTPNYESVDGNPYLADFYTDMDRWSFPLQIYFLGKRFEMGVIHGHPNTITERTTQGFDYPMRVTPEGQSPSNRDKQVLLVNQGEVVNFDGSVDPIPPRYIQLTRGLLFLGSVQAMKTTQPGIHALSDETQQRWSKAVEAELAATSESLTHPTF